MFDFFIKKANLANIFSMLLQLAISLSAPIHTHKRYTFAVDYMLLLMNIGKT